MPQQPLAGRFGVELRTLRMRAGLSVAELAERIKYSKSHVSKVENGLKSPSLEFARRCEATLTSNGVLIGLVADTRAKIPQGSGEVLGGKVRLADDQPALATPAGTALAVDGGASAGADDSLSVASLESCLDTFRKLLENLRDLGQAMGPSSIVPMLLPQIKALRDLSQRLESASVPEALLLAARFAEYTSWMTQEMGDDITALRWVDEAVRLAEEAGDHDLVAYAYVRRANIALYQQDAYGTIESARRVRAMECGRRVRGLAAQREAQGYALAGDDEAFRRCIHESAELLASAADAHGGRPALGAVRIPHSVSLAEGWGLYDLGRGEEAVRILSPLFDSTPRQSGRAWARIGARLALALASLRQIERASVIIRPVLALFPALESATIRSDIRHLARILNRWNSDQSVRQIMPQLSAALTPTADLAKLTFDYSPEA